MYFVACPWQTSGLCGSGMPFSNKKYINEQCKAVLICFIQLKNEKTGSKIRILGRIYI